MRTSSYTSASWPFDWHCSSCRWISRRHRKRIRMVDILSAKNDPKMMKPHPCLFFNNDIIITTALWLFLLLYVPKITSKVSVAQRFCARTNARYKHPLPSILHPLLWTTVELLLYVLYYVYVSLYDCIIVSAYWLVHLSSYYPQSHITGTITFTI